MHLIHLPLSKSILNRMLVLLALSDQSQPETLKVDELPNDVRIMHRLLWNHQDSHYDVEDAGTVFRFLTAYLSLKKGVHTLQGTEVLNNRPIAPLVEALNRLGAHIEYAESESKAPLKIYGGPLSGGAITLDASASSQFASALMLTAPLMEKGLALNLQNPTSIPYLHLTGECLSRFGIQVEWGVHSLKIESGQQLRPPTESISGVETDWSSAAFWYALCAVTGQSFQLIGLDPNSSQGDKVVPQLFETLGVETQWTPQGASILRNDPKKGPWAFQLADHPDLAPPLVVACAMLGASATFYGLETLRRKESDRTLALQEGLVQIGVNFQDYQGRWQLAGTPLIGGRALILDTHADHRMAMSFACILVNHPQVTLTDYSCVAKSYPSFWREFEMAFPVDSELPKS